MRSLLYGLLLGIALIMSACGGSDSGSEGTETVTVSVGGSTAACGVLCNAKVEVATLGGEILFRTTSNEYDPAADSTEYNATAAELRPFAERQAGRFSASRTFSVQSVPPDTAMLLVRVSGGHDIDPDGNGFVEAGEDRSFAGPLYAYAVLGDLKEGNVSVNFFSSAAAAVAAVRHLAVDETVNTLLSGSAAKLFEADPNGGAVDLATLTRFTPAVIENNASADFVYLNDPGAYDALAEGNYGIGLYEGKPSLWMQDGDNDGLMDAFEFLVGTDTASADSDGDGVNDYAEVWGGTDPVNGTDVKNDPLYDYQWHLENTGQASGALNGGTFGEDLDVTAGLPGYAGSGSVVVALVDTGVESGHPDLKNNLDLTLSYNYKTHLNDPVPDSDEISYHGTACAGIVGAQGYNGTGVRGVAPMTRLAGFNVFSTGRLSDIIDTFTRTGIDVFSNSWGPVTSASLTDWGDEFETALEDGAVNGRDGKGAIYVFAAGNDRTENHEGYANTSSLHNSKYAITVSSVNAHGVLSSYSNTGANVLVAGTGGEFGFDDPAIVTTDLTGLEVGRDTYYDSAGIAIADSSLDGNNPDGNYTRFMNGTSSACPSVAGIVALMLQANPALTRRDVRCILARTARQNDAADSGWSLNGAGLHINDKYGFGVADAAAAVSMAEGFVSLGAEQVSAQYTDTADADIPDADSSGIERTVNIAENMTVEHVDVWVTTEHTRIDDLRIVLTSPAGTQSVLAVGGEGYLFPLESYNDWRFSTVRSMDENAQGNWRLKVIDTTAGNIGRLVNWKIQISGH